LYKEAIIISIQHVFGSFSIEYELLLSRSMDARILTFKCIDKRLIFVFLLFFTHIFMCVSSPLSKIKYTVSLSQTNIDGSSLSIKGGDTIYIEPGHRDHLRFYNIHGDSLNYIVFINKGGLVEVSTNTYFYGIQVYNCSYFRLTGTGKDSLQYGIKIGNTPTGKNGLSLDGSSTNYEVDHIEVTKSGFAGICANPKPDCDDNLNRGNFTCRNTTFHNNYVHGTAGEAFYIGHSFYTGYTIICDSVKRVVYPHEIYGLKIFNNVVDSSGYDGIQVGCATKDCEIYGNRISNYGVSNTKDQNFGIIIGAGTGGKCYNNLIVNGTGNGINIFGLGGNLIYNNIIVNPGHAMKDTMSTDKANGIFCDDRCTIKGSSFYLLNNTIISPKGDGIRIYSKLSKNNIICNNIILNPGTLGTYSPYLSPDLPYVYTVKGVDATVTNNYLSKSVSPTVNYGNPDEVYNFCMTLPVIDKGLDVSNYGIMEDFNQNNRRVNNTCDIGAFEYPTSLIQKMKPTSIKVISVNTAGELYIYSEKKENISSVQIYQLSGQLIYSNNPNTENTTVNTNDHLKSGIYLVCVNTQNEECKTKFINCQ